MNWQKLSNLRAEFWMLFVVVLAFGTRLYGLDAQSLWFDEIFTVTMARLSWYSGMVAVLGHGVQLTPWYHWIVKIWLIVGDSDWLIRVPALIFGVLTIPLIFKLGSLYFSKKIGLFAAFIFAINPYQVWYAQELRPYSLLTLAALGAMLAFGQMLNTSGRQGKAKLLIYNLIGFPTHYFMFLIPTIQFLYLALTLKQTYALLRRWVVVQIISVLPMVMWWLFVIQQERSNVGIGWVPRPHWAAPLFTWWNFSFGYTDSWPWGMGFFVTVLLIGTVVGVWQAWLRAKHGRLMVLWLFFPLLIVTILSFGRISFYVDRYLIIVSPILTILTIYGLYSIHLKILRWGLVFVFTFATGLGLYNVYFDTSNFVKDDWRELTNLIDTQAQTDDIVVTCTDGFHLAYQYYNPHRHINPENVLFAQQLESIALKSEHQTAWIVRTHPLLSAHHLANNTLPTLDRNLLSVQGSIWQEQNFQQQITVSGISAYRYDISDPTALLEIVAWHC